MIRDRTSKWERSRTKVENIQDLTIFIKALAHYIADKQCERHGDAEKEKHYSGQAVSGTWFTNRLYANNYIKHVRLRS